ncbi:hypothetical protein KY328_01785 [Candidatus Woesearchaeota archaeon]|nr:hypothetical protein [Candidatus Woesearchaeota archaeon]MBW3021628.1 hypothetical protein [Candidatus Woesearchaeota archaeon]
MKKSIGILLVALLVISIIPLVTAENGEISEDLEIEEVATNTEKAECLDRLRERFPKVSDERLERYCVVRERVGEDLSELGERIRSRLENKIESLKQQRQEPAFSKFMFKNEWKAREISKEKAEKAKNRFTEAKNNFTNAKIMYNRAKTNMGDIKERRQVCLEDEENAECKQVKTHTKDFLSKSSDMVLTQLEKLLASIEESEDLSEEEASDMVADIKEAIEKVEDIKDKIDALADDSAKSEINELAKELRDAWKDVKPDMNIAAGKLVNARIGKTVARSGHLEARLELVLNKAADKGVEVTDLEAEIDAFNAELEDARARYREAVDKYKQARTSGDVDEGVKEAKQVMLKAQEALKKAHEKLKQVMTQLRANNATGLLNEVTEETVEEELS